MSAIALDADLSPARPLIPWAMLAVAFWLAESVVVHLEFRRDAHTFSLSEIPLVLGLFFAAPHVLLLGRLAGSACALLVNRRQPARKIAFNLANFAAQTAVALVVFHMIVPTADPFGPIGWLAAFLATAMADLTATVTVTAVIRLAGGGGDAAGTREALAVGSVSTVVNTAVGLMAVTLLMQDPRALWLLALSTGTLLAGYRAYAALRQRQEGLSALYRSTQLGRGATTLDGVLPPILEHARATFRVRVAEVVLLERDGTALSARMDDDGVSWSVAVGADDPLIERIVATTSPVMVPAGMCSESSAARGVRDLMGAAMQGPSGVMGVMVVGGRQLDSTTFADHDLRLFETFANHAGIEVANVRLIEELKREAARNEHLALHDPLTGLANRTLFRTRVHQAISRAHASGRKVAVMLVDLDRFKEVNDTLGHTTGDMLLREIGTRLGSLFESGGTVARLGGDEFGIVIGELDDLETARETAGRVLNVLQEPFNLDDLMLDLGASIGIAAYPAHGGDADTLVQRADIAMYLAKEERIGTAVYAPERDGFSPRRLALAGELRRAIGSDELTLAFQPKVDARTRELVGVEALCRWRHPRQGAIGPDVFIPIAENTGLVKPLTGWVLAESFEAYRWWRERGLDVPVSVNLSARMLRDDRLPDQIAGMLRGWNIPASALVLEITEGSLLEDPEQAIRILGALDALGVRLSIDDFGTGYSSLGYLKRLPVRELKVDRSFVLGMLEDEGDAVIVRSTVELGRNLGLEVVAEGVASEEAAQTLRGLGCHVLQGYHIAKPLTRDALLSWAMRAADRETVAPIHAIAG
ncbi:MAG TPA: EAL domain-containing protein [Actinomycetota bacterium]